MPTAEHARDAYNVAKPFCMQSFNVRSGSCLPPLLGLLDKHQLNIETYEIDLSLQHTKSMA